MKRIIALVCTFALTGLNACEDSGVYINVGSKDDDIPPETGGTDPGGENPGGTDPGGQDPGGTDPGGENPGGTDPGGQDPGGTDPGGQDPGGDPGGTPGPQPSCKDKCEGGGGCDGEGAYKTCKDGDGDGCKEWVTAECASGTKCSEGECVPSCADACDGTVECDGEGAYKTCKDGAGDGCREWVVTTCGENRKCDGGVCKDKCSSVCDKGKKQCHAKAVQTCDDYNGDGCFEWGGDSPCSYRCEGGACAKDPNEWVPPCSGAGCPEVVSDLKKVIKGNTVGGASRFGSYSCATGVSEAGPERSYVFKVDSPGTIIAGVTEPSGGDVDVHILSALDAGKCLDRGDKGASAHVNAGIYYVVADTYSGAQNAGEYNLKITFLPDSGKCGLEQTNITHVSSGKVIKLPKTGSVVQEAHLVTDHDRQVHGSGWWPSSFTDGLAAHREFSAKWTGVNVGNEWCPAGEGGSEYGQGSTGNSVPWKAEAYYVCMYWRNKPSAGTRFLVVNPQTGKAVVAAAGYETGPGDSGMLGGAVYEVHKKLGTGHKSTLTFGQMRDQGLEYGPIDCE